MPQRENTCCFTGHRPAKLPWGGNENAPACLSMKRQIRDEIETLYQKGYRHFICGMAIGCDMYFAEAVIATRKIHTDITLEAAIPCGDQPERWAENQRKRYNSLIDCCDSVTVLQIYYTPDCMQRRNQYMVDNSSCLLACFDGAPGGTMNTILYAKREGLTINILDI